MTVDILLLGMKAGLAIMAISFIVATWAGAVYGDAKGRDAND